jgi:hypothetical protein
MQLPKYVLDRVGSFPRVPSLDDWLQERLKPQHYDTCSQVMMTSHLTDDHPIEFESLRAVLGVPHKLAMELLQHHLIEGRDYASCSTKSKYALTLDGAERFSHFTGTKSNHMVIAALAQTAQAVLEYDFLTTLATEKQKCINERHDVLVQKFAKQSGCYIGLVGYRDDILCAKIGSTDDLSTRLANLRAIYGTFWFHDFIPYHNGSALERSVKEDSFLQRHRLRAPTDGIKHRELYTVTFSCGLDDLTWRIRELAEPSHCDGNSIKAQTDGARALLEAGVSPAAIEKLLLSWANKQEDTHEDKHQTGERETEDELSSVTSGPTTPTPPAKSDIFEAFRRECLIEERGTRLDWMTVAYPAFCDWAHTQGRQIPAKTKDVRKLFEAGLGQIYNSRFRKASLYGWRNIRMRRADEKVPV